MSNKVIVACTVSGPLENNSVQLIVDSIYEAWKAGASICRICIKDGRGNVLLSKEQLEETIRLIRDIKECDVIIACDSYGEVSSAVDGSTTIFDSVEGIEIGTCTVGTVNYLGEAPVYNTPSYLKGLMTTFKTKGIQPECRVLDMGMLGNTKWLIKSDYISQPLFCLMDMGLTGGIGNTVDDLLFFVRKLPAGTIWSAAAGPETQMSIIYSSIVLGGNISINLTAEGENTDVSVIKRAAVAIKEFNKDVATSAEAREILKLTAK